MERLVTRSQSRNSIGARHLTSILKTGVLTQRQAVGNTYALSEALKVFKNGGEERGPHIGFLLSLARGPSICNPSLNMLMLGQVEARAPQAPKS